jgi:hypothetical protein
MRTVSLVLVLIVLGAILAHGQGQAFPVVYPLQPVSQTVASLPAAATGNAGQIRVVSDSTTISAEGQTCTGGGTGVVAAMAFSNGTTWACF